MKTQLHKFDGGEIEYRVPIYTDLLKIYSKLDPVKLSKLNDKEIVETEKIAAIADCLEAINPLLVNIRYKNYSSMEECLGDMGLMAPMTEIFKNVMTQISQSGEETKRRKKS